MGQSVLTKPLYNKELHSHIHSIISVSFSGPFAWFTKAGDKNGLSENKKEKKEND